jgi:hypothetical protein
MPSCRDLVVFKPGTARGVLGFKLRRKPKLVARLVTTGRPNDSRNQNTYIESFIPRDLDAGTTVGWNKFESRLKYQLL